MTILIHIGFHKTATTWLQRNLFSDEQLGFQLLDRDMVLEDFVFIHPFDYCYDDSEMNKKYIRLCNEIIQKKRVPVISQERLSGSAHCGGYDCREISYRLKHCFPQAKILITIREQKDLIYSMYSQYVKHTGAYSLREYLLPKKRIKYPEFNLDHLKFDRMIRHYHSLFSKENVLVLPFEFFVENPMAFIAKIDSFCKISLDTQAISRILQHPKINTRLGGVDLSVKGWLNPFLFKNMNNLGGKFSNKLTRPLAKILLWLSRSSCPAFFQQQIENKRKMFIKQHVKNHFAKSNKLTADLIDMPLEKYGYL
jgi:hypothetical protein